MVVVPVGIVVVLSVSMVMCEFLMPARRAFVTVPAVAVVRDAVCVFVSPLATIEACGWRTVVRTAVREIRGTPVCAVRVGVSIAVAMPVTPGAMARGGFFAPARALNAVLVRRCPVVSRLGGMRARKMLPHLFALLGAEILESLSASFAIRAAAVKVAGCACRFVVGERKFHGMIWAGRSRRKRGSDSR